MQKKILELMKIKIIRSLIVTTPMALKTPREQENSKYVLDKVFQAWECLSITAAVTDVITSSTQSTWKLKNLGNLISN